MKNARRNDANKSIIILSGLIAINTVISSLAMIDIKEIKTNTKPIPEIYEATEVCETQTSYIELTDIDNNKIIVPETEIDVIEESKKNAKAIYIKVKSTKEYKIPDADTSFKSYMDYRCITNTSSNQYKLQENAWTDEDGLRRYGDDYMVAMGSYYGEVGDRFRITLENESVFTVIMGDSKADIHTDDKNMYRAVYDGNGEFISANVLEFIVDKYEMDTYVKRLGTVSGYSHLAGNIIKIEKIEDGSEKI